MNITGKQIIGYSESNSRPGSSFSSIVAVEGGSTFYAFDEASAKDVDEAAKKATEAFKIYKALSADKRINFLKAITTEINNIRKLLVATAQKETFLPEKRLDGEIDRTINQINMFADLLQEGSWVNAIIDSAIPQRQPFPKPQICQMMRPIGVTAVFGASNFPFAFSVAGGDTISALAAGCPVIYKAHFGHPVTSELVGRCIAEAAHKTAMPDGVFSLLQGATTESGQALVTHKLVKAVGFTGSLRGGKALFDLAVKRDEPIPVYAEMGSVNPVFLLPGKLKEDAAGIAISLVGSNTLAAGQFCTNPGIILMLKSPQAEQFLAQYAVSLTEAAGSPMLTEVIYSSYTKGITQLKSLSSLKLIGSGTDGDGDTAIPHAFVVSGEDFLKDEHLYEECFGPSSIHVIAEDIKQLVQIAEHLPGQLTAGIWANPDDVLEFVSLFNILEEKAGRIMINNVPTGVEVTHAMIHGGPFPATTDSRTTSVGSQAIYRFVRPVCFQNFPQSLLPPELQNDNPLKIWRKVDGKFTKDTIV